MTKHIGLRLKWAIVGALLIIGLNSIGVNVAVSVWHTPVAFLGGKIGDIQ